MNTHDLPVMHITCGGVFEVMNEVIVHDTFNLSGAWDPHARETGRTRTRNTKTA